MGKEHDAESHTGSTLGPPIVVGIGASAGGFEEFRRLVRTIPPRPGVAFIVVQHLPPESGTTLAELLARETHLPVVPVRDDVELEPNRIYVLVGGTALELQDGWLRRTTVHNKIERAGVIDRLFRSLADEMGNRATGVILSGTGSDGAIGMRAIRAAEGLTIAQLPDTAQHCEMPNHAIEAGVVDRVLDVDAIVPTVLQHFETREEIALAGPPWAIEGPEIIGPEHVEAVAEVLRDRADLDISCYKQGTVRRRIWRRMSLAQLDAPERYIDRLRESGEEVEQLVRDLHIGVTEFFRDATAFDALRSTVVDPIVERLAPGESLRVWVAGCATGEEAYSIAMLARESLEAHGRTESVQIFATDVEPESLQIARAGVYPPSIVNHVSAPRLERFFFYLGERGFQVKPEIRDAVSFAVHDLCADPPFSRMHLVSCRNVLIYLHPDTQKRVYRILHFALRQDGFLFLGSSESIVPARDLFEPISEERRVFRRLASPPGEPFHLVQALRPRRSEPPDSRTVPTKRSSRPPKSAETGYAQLLARFFPPSVIVGADGRVLYAHGKLSAWLEVPPGELRNDLSSMLREPFRTRIRSALFEARRDRREIVAHIDGRPETTTPTRTKITVRPLEDGNDALIVISFEVEDVSPRIIQPTESTISDQRLVDQLERELQATREDLRNAIEEIERANDELRAAHEQAASTNEELQSTNEELEATTEELRSLNEELSAVNVQLKEKVLELQRAHDDLANFFGSTKLATLFLDENLSIKRFTPAAEQILRLGPADLGRRVDDIARELLQNDLGPEARSVLEDLAPITRELACADRWYTRSVLPYRTDSRRIEGVVVTLVDITEVKLATMRLAARENQQAMVAELGFRALSRDDLQGLFDQAVRMVQQVLESDYCKVLELLPGGERLRLRSGVGWKPGLVGEATVSAGLESQAGFTLRAAHPVIVEDLAKERRFSGPPLLRDHGVVSGMSCIIGDPMHPFGVLGVHTKSARTFTPDDVHFLVSIANVIGAAVARAKEEEVSERLASIVESSEDAILSQTLDGTITTWNRGAEHLFGYAAEEMLGRSVAQIVPPDVPNEVPEIVARLQRGDRVDSYQTARRRKDGSRVEVSIGVSAIRDHTGQVTGASVIARDISGLKAAERALRESEDRYRRLVAHSPVAMMVYTERGEILVVNQAWTETTGFGADEIRSFDGFAQVAFREHADDLRRTLARFDSTEESYTSEIAMWTRDGHQRNVIFSSVAVGRLSNGRWLRSAVIRDVTEQRRAARRLATEHEVSSILGAARTLGEASPRVLEALCRGLDIDIAELWLPDPSGSRLECRGFHTRSLMGFPRFEATTRGCRLAPGEGLPGQVWKSGEAEWVAVTGEDAFLRQRDAKAAGLVTVIAFPITIGSTVAGAIVLFVRETWERDETLLETLSTLGRSVGNFIKRVETEDELRRSELRLQRTIESSQIAVVFTSGEGVIRDVNAALVQMLERPRDELVGRTMHDIIPSEHAEAQNAILAQLRHSGRLESLEKELVRRDGSLVPVLVSASHLGMGDEYVHFLVDLTPQKRTEHVLREADRHKDEYLAMLGHELRNPLAALTSAIQLEKIVVTDDDRLKKTRQIIDRQVKHMTKLVDGLLDASRIARGLLKIEKKPLELTALVRSIVEDHQHRASSHGLTLALDCPEESIWIEGDVTRIAQVTENLLSNAMKFTDTGGTIDVAIRREGRDVTLEVADTGVGLAPELLPTLFEPFRQGPQNLDRARGGLGIGLALVKGLIELHGGSITAGPRDGGRGAVFRVKLPVRRAGPRKSNPDPSLPTVGLRVLVVDDNRDSAETLTELLRLLGHTAEPTYDGRQALELAASFAPDCVICDIGLPGGMSGYDVARAFRRDETLSSAFLVALTGYGRDSDRTLAKDAGFDHFLAKPVGIDEISNVLATVAEAIPDPS